MSDKKPPTQYITLKPIKFFEEDLGQSDNMLFEIKSLLEKQSHLINKKKEYALEIESLKNAMNNIDAEMKDNQARLDKLEGYKDAGENKEVELSTGQTWTHKQKGYDVRIISINRTGSVAVEELATGQRDGFSGDVFLDAFTPKSKEGDL